MPVTKYKKAEDALLLALACGATVETAATGEDWQEYVTRLMREEGVIDATQEPTAEEVRRFDKKRKGKKVSNEDWKSSTDAEARITQMKDGTTHLAYKFPLFIHVEGFGTLVLGKTCRYCSRCELIVDHRDELESQLANGPAQLKPCAGGYLVIATMDMKAWQPGLKGREGQDRAQCPYEFAPERLFARTPFMSNRVVGAEVAALPRMAIQDLRARYAEVFGEGTRSGNRAWLIKRLAWRLQALAEGDLSERARRRRRSWLKMPICAPRRPDNP